MNLPAHAQSDGQSIIFVKPANAGGGVDSSSSDSAAPIAPPRSLDLSFAPHFGSSKPAAANFSPGMPSVSFFIPPAQSRRQNDLWTMMTPEEILNMQTPEQMFGLSDPEDNKSPDERFLDRLHASQNNGAATRAPGFFDAAGTSGYSDANDSSSLNPLSQLNTQSGGYDSGNLFNRFTQSPSGSANNNQNQKSGSTMWGGVFSFPAQAPKPDPQQLAEMERFAALLGTAPPPAASTPAPSLPSAASASSEQLGQYDMLGRPLIGTADISKPANLKPLSEPAGYYVPPPPAKRPAWQAQPPPWLSDRPPTTPTPWKF